MSFWDIMSLIGSLVMIVLVLAITWVLTRWYAKRMGGTGSGRYIKVLDKTAMGSGTALTVVQVGEKYYLIGLGDKSANLIAELEDFTPQEGEPAQPANFSKLLGDLMARGKDKNQDGGDGR